jgi:hypothetical protein
LFASAQLVIEREGKEHRSVKRSPLIRQNVNFFARFRGERFPFPFPQKSGWMVVSR